MKFRIALAVSLLALPGCTTHFKKSYLSVTGTPASTIGSIFVWDNDVNAAVIYKNGGICAQRAMTVITTDSGVSGAVSEALMDLASAATTAATAAATASNAAVAASGNGASLTESSTAAEASETANESLVSIAASFDRTATLLTTTTERTAFLDIGMFYLCQLGHNGTLNEASVAGLTDRLIQSASLLPALKASSDAEVPPITANDVGRPARPDLPIRPIEPLNPNEPVPPEPR